MAKTVNDYDQAGGANSGDDDAKWQHEYLGRDMLELVGRNHKAVADILADKDGGPSFVSSIYSHKWSDKGASAANLTDWIADGVHGGDHHAPAAWDNLVDDLTQSGDNQRALAGPSTFKTLVAGGHDSAMNANPRLADSLTRVVAANLDDFSSPKDSHALVSDADQARVMMLLASNKDNARAIGAAVHHYEDHLAREYIQSPEKADEYAKKFANLQGKFDVGIYNHFRYEKLDAVDADKARLSIYQDASHLATTTAAEAPTPWGLAADATDRIMAKATQAPVTDPNNVSVPSSWVEGDDVNKHKAADDREDYLQSLMASRVNNALLNAAIPHDDHKVTAVPDGTNDDTIREALWKTRFFAAGDDKTRLNTFNDTLNNTYASFFQIHGPGTSINDFVDSRDKGAR